MQLPPALQQAGQLTQDLRIFERGGLLAASGRALRKTWAHFRNSSSCSLEAPRAPGQKDFSLLCRNARAELVAPLRVGGCTCLPPPAPLALQKDGAQGPPLLEDFLWAATPHWLQLCRALGRAECNQRHQSPPPGPEGLLFPIQQSISVPCPLRLVDHITQVQDAGSGQLGSTFMRTLGQKLAQVIEDASTGECGPMKLYKTKWQ